jgi:4-azaleucine resistance transporter AzlC
MNGYEHAARDVRGNQKSPPSLAENLHQDKIKPQRPSPLTSADFRRGAVAAWPICLGYFPIGLALGVLAQQAGLPWWAMALMSVLVFAGSSQFICVALLATGASIPSIVLTTLMVNLRHVLMSSALAVHLNGIDRSFLAVFAYGITDESFAVNMARFRQGNWNRWSALITNLLPNLCWISATTVGVLVGQFIPRGAFGIDYALVAMFLCLLTYQLHSRLHIFTALVAALVAPLWHLLIPGSSSIIGASVIAASCGYCFERRRRRKR